MLFYTHLAFSVLVGIFTIDYLSINNKLLFFSLLLIFTLVPDIDAAKSKIGKKLSFFSKIINFIFGHRNFFHSLLFIILIYLIFSFFSDLVAISFLIAASSHLILDALTLRGIAPFYPMKFRVKGFIKTGKLFEKMLFILFLALIIIKMSTGHP